MTETRELIRELTADVNAGNYDAVGGYLADGILTDDVDVREYLPEGAR